MKRFYTHTLPALLLLLLLAACADDDTDSTDDDDDELVGGRLMGELTLTGTASLGYPLSWQRICAPPEELISVSYNTLVTTGNANNMPSLEADDCDSAVEGCRLSSPPPDPFSVQITADPERGDAPLTSRTRVALVNAPDETTVSTRLINPRGQETEQWTSLERTLNLDMVGVYQVVTTATSSTAEVTRGALIAVGLSEVTLDTATWGEAGSCSPASLGSCSQNMCLEKLDGTQARPTDANNCSAFEEVNQLLYSDGICSNTAQFDQPLLGVCSILLQETRLFFYRNTDPAETARQQHDREAERCRNNWSGHWDSAL